MTRVNKNKINNLFSETNVFRIRLKVTQFYSKIILLLLDHHSGKNFSLFFEMRNKIGEHRGVIIFARTSLLRLLENLLISEIVNVLTIKNTESASVSILFYKNDQIRFLSG